MWLKAVVEGNDVKLWLSREMYSQLLRHHTQRGEVDKCPICEEASKVERSLILICYGQKCHYCQIASALQRAGFESRCAPCLHIPEVRDAVYYNQRTPLIRFIRQAARAGEKDER